MTGDVTGAFLYGAMTRDVYIALPVEANAPGSVGYLRKSLYGLRDAPQIWKAHRVATLKNAGFDESPTMPGILRHGPRELKVSAHVDDILCSGL